MTYKKGTVRVISSDPLYKDGMPDLQRYFKSLKVCNKYAFCMILLIFISGFSAKVTCALFAYKK